MAKHSSSHRGRGSSRLPSARVAWLPLTDNDIQGTLTSANLADEVTLYDFGSTQKYADNYGGGDWTVVRTIGTLGFTVNVEAAAPQLVKICFAIGMVNPRLSVTDSPVSQVASPLGFPELSWMVEVCCYIQVGPGSIAASRVEKCEFDLRGKRVIGERSIMAYSMVSPGIPALANIEYAGDLRQVIRQRGSRL